MRTTLCLCILAVAIGSIGFAQPTESLNSRTATILARMASTDMATRHAGLDDLIKMIAEGQRLGFDPEYGSVLDEFLARHPEQADRVKLGLINLLKLDDNAFMDPNVMPGTYTEPDTEHWAAAIDLVSCLNDERAIPALVGAMTAGGGSCKGLLNYGQKPLGLVLNELRNPNPLVRSSAVNIAIEILKMKNDAAARAQIFNLIRTALGDPEFLVRSAALYAIGNLRADQSQFVPALQNMSQSDPFFLSGENRYPLRDRARKLLEQIENHH